MVDAGAADCGGQPVRDSTWRLGADGALADVVVAVSQSPSASNRVPESIEVACRDCDFFPKVLVLQPGQRLALVSEETSELTVRLFRHESGGAEDKPMLEDVLAAGAKLEISLPSHPGVVRVECAGRPWMTGWVLIHSGIHAGVTGEDGSYEITRALPDGEYEVVAWHPRFRRGLKKTVLVVNGTGTLNFAFDFNQSLDAPARKSSAARIADPSSTI
jgi:hypothetical protein